MWSVEKTEKAAIASELELLMVTCQWCRQSRCRRSLCLAPRTRQNRSAWPRCRRRRSAVSPSRIDSNVLGTEAAASSIERTWCNVVLPDSAVSAIIGHDSSAGPHDDGKKASVDPAHATAAADAQIQREQEREHMLYTVGSVALVVGVGLFILS